MVFSGSPVAVRQDNFAPQVTAAGYAVVGVVVGLLIAVAALNARAVAANVMASTAYLWALAIVAVLGAYPLRRLVNVRPATIFRGEA